MRVLFQTRREKREEQTDILYTAAKRQRVELLSVGGRESKGAIEEIDRGGEKEVEQ